MLRVEGLTAGDAVIAAAVHGTLGDTRRAQDAAGLGLRRGGRGDPHGTVLHPSDVGIVSSLVSAVHGVVGGPLYCERT